MRDIRCGDGLAFLAGFSGPCSIVTSPPLAHEMGWEIGRWASFYLAALRACFGAIAPDAPAIIYSTDQKHDGRIISSFDMMMEAAHSAKMGLLWHKIVARREPGQTDIHRPGFTHLAAFGGPNARPGAASPDIIRRGPVAYQNGMGLAAARMACSFAGKAGRPILDPFCGHGTIPAVAEALGFPSIGIDIDPAQCEAARKLSIHISNGPRL